MRVGFSIHNLTGQPVRYLQQWEGGVKTVQYLNNGERGLLNFVASTTLIRNNLIVEETFNVQMEKNADSRSRNKKKIVGNRVALQVSGYRWLRGVQADELGFRFEHLEAVLGRKTAGNIYSDQMIVNSLKLVTEVIPHCGGRMLKLRSVFLLKNNTRHSINILAKQAEDMESDDWQPSAHQGRELPFQLNAGCNHYVPMALLQNSALRSKGRSLGLLYLQPTEIGPIEDELEGIGNLSPSSVDYTTDPINLYQTVAAAANAAEDTENVAKTFGEYRNLRVHKNDSAISDSGDLHSGQHGIQLCCNVNPMSRRGTRKSSFSGNRSFDGDRPMENRRNDFLRDEDFVEHNATNKLPLFCYCVEVLRHRAAHLYKGKQNRVRSFAEEHHLRNEQTMAERFFNVQGNKECYSPEQPYHYTIGMIL